MKEPELMETIKIVDIPANPVLGYPEKYHVIGLFYYKAGNKQGTKWFIANVKQLWEEFYKTGSFSCTWVTDAQAQQFMADAITDEIIAEEKTGKKK